MKDNLKLFASIMLVLVPIVALLLFANQMDRASAETKLRTKYYQGVFDDCMTLLFNGDPAAVRVTCQQHVKDAQDNHWYEYSQQPDSYWTPIPGGEGG